MVEKPSFFEITVIIRETKYRYGFKITNLKIVEEWLFYAESRIRENYLFIRTEQQFQISKTWNKESGNKVETQGVPFTKSNILLLSVLASLDKIPRIESIFTWLKGNIIIDDNAKGLMSNAALIYTQIDYRDLINKFLKNADLGFTSIFDKISEKLRARPDFDKTFLNVVSEEAINDFELYVRHDVFNEKYERVDSVITELEKTESSGTIKYFIMATFLSFAIKNSQLIWIDELDSSLHTHLFQLLIKAYNLPSLNSNSSQLIYSTHNTILMNKKIRRDQIVFVQKNDFGESSIQKMHTKDRPVRVDKSVEKEYREGNLGGVSKKISNSLFDGLDLNNEQKNS